MKFTKVFIDLVKTNFNELRCISLLAIEIDNLRFRIVDRRCFENPNPGNLKEILEEVFNFSSRFTKKWNDNFIISSPNKAGEIKDMFSKNSIILPFGIFDTNILLDFVSDIESEYSSEIVVNTPHLNKIATESQQKKKDNFYVFNYINYACCFYTAIIYGYVKAVMSSIETLKKLAGKLLSN